jgi:UDP-N-acetyl-D-mannosaminuronic acid dehydrogenase
MKKVCVIGLGCIGLPTACILSSKGFKVVGVDTDPKLVDELNQVNIAPLERGLANLANSAIKSGNFIPKTSPEEADVFIICVPTPPTEENKADLTYVKDAAESILPYLRKDNLVILESTVPPGTTGEILQPILEKSGLKIENGLHLAYCPERVLPGNVLKELVGNDRIIGGINPESAELAKEIYQSFVEGEIYLTGAAIAEMVKLAENSFRDVNIAFANEFSRICDKLNLRVWEVIELANRHPRVNILKPGPGVGGHCVAVDPFFIVEKAPDEAKLIQTARRVNDSMPDYVVEKVERAVKEAKTKSPIIACLGITYKAGTGNLRRSPALKVIRRLREKGYTVLACDPYIEDFAEFPLFSLKKVAKGADCLILLVDHEEFKKIDPHDLLSKMRASLIIDTRGIWSSTESTNHKSFKGKRRLPVYKVGDDVVIDERYELNLKARDRMCL